MALLCACVCGGVAIGGVVAAIRRSLFRKIAHIATGALRRTLFPPEVAIGPGAESALRSDDIEVRREIYTLKSGAKMFCQIILPKRRPPSHVFVFLHGYTSQSDLYLEANVEFARQGAVVVLPDLPCHGRSDGLLTYIPDWWEWVGHVWELLDQVVPVARSLGERPLPVFAGGMSLGGGLVACLALQRPAFFNGIVLIAPMLFVSDEIKPPWIVQQVFKFVLKPLLPMWPVTPTKSMDELDFRVPEQGLRFCTCNPLSMQGLQARLATAMELGFTFPAWMEGQIAHVSTPFLVLHGTADKVTDPNLSQRLHDEACAKDKSIKMFDGAYHGELFCCLPGNSKLIDVPWLPEQVATTEACIKEIASWLAARI